MRYQIVHTTTYTYKQPVALKPHLIKLQPRCDGTQKLHSFSLKIDPEPIGISHTTDLDGNAAVQTWFDGTTTHLNIEGSSEVETYRTNPFDYLLEPYAMKLPIDYPTSILAQLSPYLQRENQGIADPGIARIAQDIWFASSGDIGTFLTKVNQCIYESCQYQIRETGDPLPAGITWNQKSGSCRDFAVLFMEVCRAVNIAARFASGYQEGDPNQKERELHAWAEVYLPGAGWRGYDPTLGLAVGDRHIPLVASAFPSYTAPVSGSFSPAATQFSMTANISIEIQ